MIANNDRLCTGEKDWKEKSFSYYHCYWQDKENIRIKSWVHGAISSIIPHWIKIWFPP